MDLTPNAVTPALRLLNAFERRGGLLTRRDIAALGFNSDTLQQVLRAGTVVRAAHGLYRLADVVPFGTAAFAQACLAIPSGVITLVSALAYYELTTQIVSIVELAVPRNVPRRTIEIPLSIIPMPLSRFASEIKRVRGEAGERFQIFSPERTICDCFDYDSHVPEAIAYEGLRSYLESRNADLSRLMDQAEFTKTAHIIAPVIKVRFA